MSGKHKTIRQSQAVTSFGVGAIYDVLGESFVLCDTTLWEMRPKYNAVGREVRAKRLVEDLQRRGHRVERLHEPVEMEDAKAKRNAPPRRGLPYHRFPRWLFCSACRMMTYWDFERERDMGTNPKPPTCPKCREERRLTPMRFIVICDEGHMGDVPWSRWAHSGPQTDGQRSCRAGQGGQRDQRLKFSTRTGRGGGFDSLVVECTSCGAFRSLDGLTRPNALAEIGRRCSGRQPWESPKNADRCDRPTYVVQRGAGNVYYPAIASALIIPPESDPDSKSGGDDVFERIINDHEFQDHLTGEGVDDFVLNYFRDRIAARVGCSPAEVDRAMEGGSAPPAAGEDNDIATEEWEALTRPHTPTNPRSEFVNEPVPLVDASSDSETACSLDALVGQVMAVRKLREVRALQGFFRYKPGGTEEGEGQQRMVPPDLGKESRWLPATEVFGEGIFITLSEERLREWESDPLVVERARTLDTRRADSDYSPILPKGTPRFILLHTLSHLLIRRLAFSCGYASASLRERIYSTSPDEGPPRAGILIYTAAGDAEGTLGGLVRQAEPPRLVRNLIAALYDGTQCSSDPVCRESGGQGLGAMNLAACHACALTAETSCTSMNLMLDRVMVVGDGRVPGFFERPLELALTASTA